jgi:hypothetical protein
MPHPLFDAVLLVRVLSLDLDPLSLMPSPLFEFAMLPVRVLPLDSINQMPIIQSTGPISYIGWRLFEFAVLLVRMLSLDSLSLMPMLFFDAMLLVRVLPFD